MSTSVGARPPIQPVVRAAQFVLAHVPDLVCSGSKPRRELEREGPGLREKIREHLRSFDAAVAYAPHQVMIGNLAPEALWDRPRPWHATARRERVRPRGLAAA